ncbi:MAG: glycosyltransferase family 2 protein [Ignavibacteriae bacterium]|nr:glycosyltransferase family 2 protein [Ignavibacteriota bacterium]
MPLISVIICTYRREALALRAIRSVMENSFSDFEIIVVDQDPSRNLQSLISAEFKDCSSIAYYFIDTPGLSHARNHGMEKAKGKILVFLDDDAQALPFCLESYAQAFALQPPPSMVGGKLLAEWESAKPRWYPKSRCYLLGLYDIGESVVEFPECDLPIGANFAILKSELLAIGGFDVSFGFNAMKTNALGGEDSLVGMKVKQRGGQILYHPRAAASHLVRKEKLFLRNYLRRHYLEGRTQIAIQKRVALKDKAFYFGAMRWHAGSIMKKSVSLLLNVFNPSTDRLECLGDYIGSISLSLGVISECLISFRSANR